MLLNSSSLGYYFRLALGYFQSHCYRPSSASRYTNLTGNGSRLRCGSRGGAARSQGQERCFEAGSRRFSCSQFPAGIALASGGHTPGGCFFSALPPINGQSRKFRLLYRNFRRFRPGGLGNL